ncbi:aldo/keto reductase family protein [Paenibacillus sp. LHD-117]|uniref:aldo/keto reductase family protein n=1 Tax=Paenibacillus sp. LHD-117 TaxID=3071412 RepID=UPI0027DFCE32|nr:aldo/keto reductase family protein [Paenibacillus sp. LHD-117]MDQ6420544.1 aldo/keto reductase family protein [Paenibacillus sp. LHD-117]
MKYRRLGRSGLQVSEIALGSWLTHENAAQAASAAEAIRKAYELGVNYFDTANMYAGGEAERIMGRALSGYARDTYVLGTKVYFDMGQGANQRGLSRKHIMEQCEASLRRLDVEYIDLYYCHRYDEHTPLDETLRAMDDLVTQGKVLYVGISEWREGEIAESAALAERLKLDPIVVNQPEYNMFTRRIEPGIVPLCERLGIGQAVFSPLAHGVLSGKYRKGEAIPQESRAANPEHNHWIVSQGLLSERRLDQVERLSGIAGELGITLVQLALAWNLRMPNVSCCIVGATRPEQVAQNVSASGIGLPEDALKEIENILSE